MSDVSVSWLVSVPSPSFTVYRGSRRCVKLSTDGAMAPCIVTDEAFRAYRDDSTVPSASTVEFWRILRTEYESSNEEFVIGLTVVRAFAVSPYGPWIPHASSLIAGSAISCVSFVFDSCDAAVLSRNNFPETERPRSGKVSALTRYPLPSLMVSAFHVTVQSDDDGIFDEWSESFIVLVEVAFSNNRR